MSAPAPVRVFVSYAHKDREWCDQLLVHLGWLRNAGRIDTFDDRELESGEDWDARLRHELNRADVIVLIVTAYFLDSPFCTRVELRRALERYTEVLPLHSRSAHSIPGIVPILLQYGFGSLRS